MRTIWRVQYRHILDFQELVPVLSEEHIFFGFIVALSNMAASRGYFSIYMWLVLRGVVTVKYTPDSKDIVRKIEYKHFINNIKTILITCLYKNILDVLG